MPEGKAKIDSKAEHTRQYSCILNRFYAHLNFHKNRCVIPIYRGNTAIGHKMHF